VIAILDPQASLFVNNQGDVLKLIIASICVLMTLLLPDVSNANIATTKKAIIWAFCGHSYKPCWLGREAIKVSDCETGGTFSIWAGVGKHDYWGLFQMGSSERETWGYGNDPWEQARSAYRMYMATRYEDRSDRWSRWDCKP